MPSSSFRPGAAWTAESRSATTVARSATSSPSGTTWPGGETGPRPSSGCTPPTTSRSSPAGSARRPARQPASSASTSRPVTIKQVEVTIDRARLRGRGRVDPAAAGAAVRQDRRGRRLRPGRPRRRPAADPRRPHRRRLRAGRRASAACCATASPSSRWRRPSSTAGSRRWRPRAPSSAPASTSASTSPARQLRSRYDAVVLAGRRDRAARPARPGPRARRHPPRDGVPAAGQPGRATASRSTGPDHRRGQGRRHHRRRRHRRRLPRHLAPPGRPLGHPAGDHAPAAARTRAASHPVADRGR